MAIFSGLNISASGMSAQRIRMDILAENAANVKTTRGDDNQPYRRKNVVFMEKPATNFSTILNSVTGYRNSYIGNGVKVTEIVEDTKTPMNMVYDPSHPDADENAPVPTVTITGIGNYTGTKEMTFKICDSIKGAVIEGLDNYACTYTSLPCEPNPTSVVLDGEPLLENRDYILEYEDNIESNYRNGNPRKDYEGVPKVLIVGTGKYGGTKKITFRIDAVMLAGTNAAQIDATRFVTSV